MAILGQRAARKTALSSAGEAAKECARLVQERLLRTGPLARACSIRVK